MESFPPAMQAVITAIAGLIAVAVHFYGQLKKNGPEKSKDVVVPSVNLLDGQTFRDAANMLREASLTNEARERMMRKFMAELEELNESSRRQVELLENIDRRIAQEHYRLREMAKA